MNVMMPNSFSEKIAQREELSAAYERIDELETALRMVRDYLYLPRYAGSTLAEQFSDEFLGAIDDVLDPVGVPAAQASEVKPRPIIVIDPLSAFLNPAHDEAFAAVFSNGG